MKWRLVLAGLFLAAPFVYVGCEVGSADSVSRGVTGGDNATIDVSGFYTGGRTNGSYVPITSINSGSPLTTLDLRQYGDQLEAVDNFGRVWKGTIGDADSGTATITLQYGDLTISGTIAISGTEGSYTGTMNGSWIEPGVYGTIHATASIPGYQEGSDSGGTTNSTTNATTNVTVALSISPAGPVTLSSAGSSQLFTASGGSGSYVQWSLSANLGALSAVSGATTIYQRGSATGTQTLTVKDSDGSTKSVTINQP